jgi:hypothetical protein
VLARVGYILYISTAANRRFRDTAIGCPPIRRVGNYLGATTRQAHQGLYFLGGRESANPLPIMTHFSS